MDEAAAALLEVALSDSDPEIGACIIAAVTQMQLQMTIMRITATAAQASNAPISLNYYMRLVFIF